MLPILEGKILNLEISESNIVTRTKVYSKKTVDNNDRNERIYRNEKQRTISIVKSKKICIEI